MNRLRGWWWVLPAFGAGVLAAVIMVVLPADRSIDSVWEVLFKTSPLVLAVLAVAGFPQRRGLGLGLVFALFVVYMGVMDTFYITRIDDYAAASGAESAFPPLYQAQLFVASFTVLAVLFAYRLGGAGTVRVARAGLAAVLVMISGLNDLTFWATYHWPDGRPTHLKWASHITVFYGHQPSVVEAAVFLAVHLALAAAVLTVPLRRFSAPRSDPA
ncbi:hypothetical protein [Longispora urticae]